MSRQKLLLILAPVIAVVFGGIGWFGKDLQLNGVVGAAEPTLFGGLTITGIVAMGFSIYSAWKIAGGKFDGKTTPQELAAMVNAVANIINPSLDEKLAPFINKLSPSIAPVVNKVVGPVESAITNLIPGGAVTATRLLDWIEAWYKDPKETANEPALLNTFLDKLSEVVKADDEGSKAAATLRARLHAVLNTPTPDEIKVT